jgi:hypothetical protein
MRVSAIVLLVICALLALSCGNPTQPCGAFTFNATPISRGENVNVNFNFNPALCGAACTCNTIAYIQIVRVVDRNTGAFLAPNSDQQNRIVTGQADATQNGWSVDRLSGRVWGYYGRNNDGVFSPTLTTGSNTSTATLRDMPSGWDDNVWLDFVSVPVCIDNAASCNNTLDGYWYWFFIVGTGGTTGQPFSEVGVDWMQDAFDKSVNEWNNDAPGLGKNSFPAMTRM